MTAQLIAVYGAYGHTGRLVAAELLARGRDIVLAGRDTGALERAAAELGAPGRVTVRTAPVEDPDALRRLAAEAGVLVHCAGPFSVTGAPVAAAAAESGCPYVDHALEPHHVKAVFDTQQATAQRTGSVMIPGLSFYGGLGDLLAGAVADGLSAVDKLIVAYAVTGWRLTTGAKNTAAQLFAETQRITFTDGTLRVGQLEPVNVVFPFPPPLGPRTMLKPLPSFEPVTVPRHIPVRTVETLLTQSTFEEEKVFESEDLDPASRARSAFTVAAQAITQHGGRVGTLSGHDLWRAGALASVEAAIRLTEGRGPSKTGVLSPAEAFQPTPFLHSLEEQGAFTMTLPQSPAGAES
ncbi:saccharopine dehydrogenase NADP-binding domain-containing protein [Streptomyces sp. ODS28]|uniref:saccharopine dehydrogenase NADP-binding domain-containing protein n=1 Tax=Streptomyces sp. ODS28 TaxID=3136688 RepID=UPI0031EA3D13